MKAYSLLGLFSQAEWPRTVSHKVMFDQRLELNDRVSEADRVFLAEGTSSAEVLRQNCAFHVNIIFICKNVGRRHSYGFQHRSP